MLAELLLSSYRVKALPLVAGTTTAREAEPLRADSATKRQEADGFSVPASGVPRQEEPRASNGTAPLGESPDLQTNGWNGAAQRSQNGAMEQPSEAPVGSPGVADGGSLLEDNATMKATGNRFVSEIESSEFARWIFHILLWPCCT